MVHVHVDVVVVSGGLSMWSSCPVACRRVDIHVCACVCMYMCVCMYIGR